jgi:MacB-like periplasmic core domain
MAAKRNAPFSVLLCHAIIHVAARLVPAPFREEWKREWSGEVWHRWEFLRCVGEWHWRSALRLLRGCCGAFIDAGWLFASQSQARRRLHEWARSPWLCLGMLALLLGVIGAITGFAATRQVLFGAQQPPNLAAIWLHLVGGGGDRGLPAELAPAWSAHSRLLEGAAAFTERQGSISARGVTAHLLVVKTDPNLFALFDARPALGSLPRSAGAVIDHKAWVSVFHSDQKIIGSAITVDGAPYRVAAVLPASFHFLSRKDSVYLIEPQRGDTETMILARTKPDVTAAQLQRNLARTAEDCCYYFYGSDLRLRFQRSAVLTPLRFFGMAVAIGAAMLLAVARIRLRAWPAAWTPTHRRATLRRLGFFLGKTGLALGAVFAAGLEWSRPQSAILFGSRDPASGPFLVWLYILGAMGVLFWSFADQRSRCRVCLRLLCSPVRIGCPGCLLLDWSGTELLCTEGHGLLHVPHMAPSWDEDPEHWIALDESWKDLFAHSGK